MAGRVWYCPTCDTLFNDNQIRYEDELESGYTHRICERCGTWDELAEADLCKVCDEPIKPDTEYCETCIEILKVGLKDTIRSLDCKDDVFMEFCDWIWENEDVWREDEGEV